MTDRERLQAYLAEVIGIRPITETAREVVFALVGLPAVQARFATLTPEEIREAATAYLERVHEAAMTSKWRRKRA